MDRNGIGIYHSTYEKKLNEFEMITCSLQNLLFLDGAIENDTDRFELQLSFTKAKQAYDVFCKELGESIKLFRREINHLNVSVWQRKLGLGIGQDYTLRIRTRDRSTLRSVISMTQKYIKGKNQIANSIRKGVWLAKEIV
jgi:hypothetical protein